MVYIAKTLIDEWSVHEILMRKIMTNRSYKITYSRDIKRERLVGKIFDKSPIIRQIRHGTLSMLTICTSPS